MRVWPLIIFLIVECTIPEFPEQGQSGYEQLPSWLKGWYHLPFQLLRVITPGILWFNLRLYKPLTARCESAFLSGKIEKSETAQERTRQTDGGEKRLSTVANLTIRSCLEPAALGVHPPLCLYLSGFMDSSRPARLSAIAVCFNLALQLK